MMLNVIALSLLHHSSIYTKMGQCSSATRMKRKRRKGDQEGESMKRRRSNKGCLAMVKERRSRFYIARRCILMLLCWHKYANFSS
ncbi:unnamed protein product [Cochlearia groenlandica]